MEFHFAATTVALQEMIWKLKILLSWVEHYIFCSHELKIVYFALMNLTLNILLSESEGLLIYCIMILDRMGGSFYHTFTWEKGRRGCQPYFMVLAPFVRHISDIPDTNLSCVFFFTIDNIVWLLFLSKQFGQDQPPSLLRLHNLSAVSLKTKWKNLFAA